MLPGVAGAVEAPRFSGSYLTLCWSAGYRAQEVRSRRTPAASPFLLQSLLKPDCRLLQQLPKYTLFRYMYRYCSHIVKQTETGNTSLTQ